MDINSEAYCVGVIPGSVLVDVNGMAVLGEPTHKLLERLWWYERQLDQERMIDSDYDYHNSGDGDENGKGDSGDLRLLRQR